MLIDDVEGDPVVQVLRNDSTGSTVALSPAQTPAVDEGAILVLAGDVDGLDNGDDLITINATSEGGIAAGGGGPVSSDLTVVINGARPPCPANICGVGDDTVNVLDLLAIISSWGPCVVANNCPADINDDGTVNVLDLLLVIGEWGPCP